MRWSHVEHHLLADVGTFTTQCRIRCGHAGDRIRRFNLANRKWHGRKLQSKKITTLEGQHLRWRVSRRTQDKSRERTLAACWRWHSAIANFIARAQNEVT